MNEKNPYLELLEKGNITPNFWCSDEYFKKANLKEVESLVSPVLFVMDEDWMVFPPINTETFQLEEKVFEDQKVWSDFVEWKPEGMKSQYLDLEYIYNPKDFLTMEGGKWSVFRKNCRKWPRRFGNGNLTYDWISLYPLFGGYTIDSELDEILLAWLETKPSEKIHDDKVLVEYLHHGKNRKALWDKKGKIYGINIWDSNYLYVNFRYCICRPEEFLSEYLRLLFYTDPHILEKDKLVNDGGILDSPNLQKFKEKMNPLRIRKVYSWIL